MPSLASSPLADVPAEQILKMAVGDLKTAPAYTMTGRLFQKVGTEDVTMRVLRGTGYESTLSSPSYGTFTILEVDGTAWLKPDAEFLRAHVARRRRRRTAALAGKYIRCTSASASGVPPGIAAMTCLANPAPGSVTKDPIEFDDRQEVISLLSMSGGTAAYVTVTDSATPQIIEASISRCHPVCSVAITYGTPAALAAPPPDQTVDGGPYGL